MMEKLKLLEKEYSQPKLDHWPKENSLQIKT
jgi:hypothetical protein